MATSRHESIQSGDSGSISFELRGANASFHPPASPDAVPSFSSLLAAGREMSFLGDLVRAQQLLESAWENAKHMDSPVAQYQACLALAELHDSRGQFQLAASFSQLCMNAAFIAIERRLLDQLPVEVLAERSLHLEGCPRTTEILLAFATQISDMNLQARIDVKLAAEVTGDARLKRLQNACNLFDCAENLFRSMQVRELLAEELLAAGKLGSARQKLQEAVGIGDKLEMYQKVAELRRIETRLARCAAILAGDPNCN